MPRDAIDSNLLISAAKAAFGTFIFEPEAPRLVPALSGVRERHLVAAAREGLAALVSVGAELLRVAAVLHDELLLRAAVSGAVEVEQRHPHLAAKDKARSRVRPKFSQA